MHRLAFVLMLASQAPAAQPPPSTDIWLARLSDTGIEQPINITNRPGYDNQPSFTPDGKGLLFTRSTGAHTDIYAPDNGANAGDHRVFNTMIKQTVKLGEAPLTGKPVTDYATGSAAARAFRDLAQEVIELG